MGGLLVCTTGYELLVLFYAVRSRRRHQPAAANNSSPKLAGSGTAALAISPAPLPGGCPKFARHVL